MRIFCLDTSAFIEPWIRRYPIDVFPTYWQQLELWISEQRIISPQEVCEDIKKKEDDLYKWVKRQDGLFKMPEAEVQKALQNVLNIYQAVHRQRRHVDPNAIPKEMQGSDPWVIAQAKASSAVVVSGESRGANEPCLKIPNICARVQVECINVLSLIREMELKL